MNSQLIFQAPIWRAYRPIRYLLCLNPGIAKGARRGANTAFVSRGASKHQAASAISLSRSRSFALVRVRGRPSSPSREEFTENAKKVRNKSKKAAAPQLQDGNHQVAVHPTPDAAELFSEQASPSAKRAQERTCWW